MQSQSSCIFFDLEGTSDRSRRALVPDRLHFLEEGQWTTCGLECVGRPDEWASQTKRKQRWMWLESKAHRMPNELSQAASHVRRSGGRCRSVELHKIISPAHSHGTVKISKLTCCSGWAGAGCRCGCTTSLEYLRRDAGLRRRFTSSRFSG